MESYSKKEEEKEKLKKRNAALIKKGFAWRPVPTILSTTLCFSISGMIFIVVGAVLVWMTSHIKEYVVRYDNIEECASALNNTDPNNKTCTIQLQIDETFEPPVMFYLQLNNFYQDHRRYINSKSVKQLKGEVLTQPDIKTDCDPILTMADVGIYKSIGGYSLSPNDVANPCGLVAKSLFNDTYSFSYKGMPIYINDTDISWPSDRNGRYVKPPNASMIQWTDVEDEHFMVWMRPAGLPDFRKLWGRIYTRLDPGTYNLYIVNNYPVYEFQGKKSVVLSTVNTLGGKNNFLGIAYLVVGCICIIMALLFWVGYKNYNNDKKLN